MHVARDDLKALLGLLDVRHLAGDEIAEFDAAVERSVAVALDGAQTQ